MDHKKPPYPDYIADYKRDLRQNMSDAENRLWHHLRDRRFENLKFRRQHPIPPYIADFFCQKMSLIIELDGGQHGPDVVAERTKFLADQGYRIIRFWNNDILHNTEGVLVQLKDTL